MWNTKRLIPRKYMITALCSLDIYNKNLQTNKAGQKKEVHS